MPPVKISSLQRVSQVFAALQTVVTETAGKTAVAERGATSLTRLRRLLPVFGRPPPACDNVRILGKFVNLDLARQMVDDNRTNIVARDPSRPPAECGLLAIVAYTAGHLDRKIADMERIAGASGCRTELMELASAKALIAATVGRIEKTAAPVVRRNVQLTRDLLDAYQPGKTVQFDRLTSVTCAPAQVYTGGNVDFVIHTANGVVSLDALSLFKNNGVSTTGGEVEGMPDIGSRYRVVDVVAGKENRRPSPDEALYPARTIILREISADDQGA